jgi:hypothetical protein
MDLVKQVRALQASDAHINYQENMSDNFAALHASQAGIDIAHNMADGREARAADDAIHDTSASLRFVADHVDSDDLEGKNTVELASMTAKMVKTAMGMDASFDVVDNGKDDAGPKLFEGKPAPQNHGNDSPDRTQQAAFIPPANLNKNVLQASQVSFGGSFMSASIPNKIVMPARKFS